MAEIIRWYLCPLITAPDGRKMPHAWVNRAAGRKTSFNFRADLCLLRVTAETALHTSLMGTGTPLRCLPLAALFSTLSSADRTAIRGRVSAANGEQLSAVIDRLGASVLTNFNRQALKRTYMCEGIERIESLMTEE